MPDIFPIERSDYLDFYLREQMEVEKLKWIESEREGHDIGIHRARWLWMTTHRAAWIASIRASGVLP